MNRPGGNWGGGNSSAHEPEGLESKGKFIITGGILIGGGGDNSTPTTSVCKQYSAFIGSLSEGQVLSIKDASGNTALIYKVEKSCNSFLVSTPEF